MPLNKGVVIYINTVSDLYYNYGKSKKKKKMLTHDQLHTPFSLSIILHLDDTQDTR